MTTLAGFLLARIAEDEVHARAASIGSEAWRLDDLGETVCWWPPERESVLAFEREHGLPLSDQWRGQTIETAGEKIAPHIARHDPARVLAECEAKRQIVGLHGSASSDPYESWTDAAYRAKWGVAKRVCTACGGSFTHPNLGRSPASVYWPCPTLRALALPYADHEDFDPAWSAGDAPC